MRCGYGNHWAKVLGMGMGVGMSQREWEGMESFLMKSPNRQIRVK